ncbi:hypothetical protein TSMEX_009877 [Taenia solium]|eukprot:TsM_001231100 transcript=TsM_001231100 gene=TsM_001231100
MSTRIIKCHRSLRHVNHLCHSVTLSARAGGVNEGTNADVSAATAVVFVPLVEAMEIGEAAIGRCDVESADTAGDGDK